jgi:hypothetical protein
VIIRKHRARAAVLINTDGAGRWVNGGGSTDDELNTAGRVLSQTRLYGSEDLVVFDYTRNNGTDGSQVPIEVTVLPK